MTKTTTRHSIRALLNSIKLECPECEYVFKTGEAGLIRCPQCGWERGNW